MNKKKIIMVISICVVIVAIIAISIIWKMKFANLNQEDGQNISKEEANIQKELNTISQEAKNDVAYQNTTDIEDLKASVGATRSYRNLSIS